jgi:hypothetical protein
LTRRFWPRQVLAINTYSELSNHSWKLVKWFARNYLTPELAESSCIFLELYCTANRIYWHHREFFNM